MAAAVGGGILGGAIYYGWQTLRNPCAQWDWGEAAFWSITGGGIGGLLGLGIYGGWWVGVQLVQRAGVWSQAPLQRGVAIENILGRSSFLARNFPTIDRFVNGVATSIKSIDLRAVSYQDIGTLTRTVKGYIDTMAVYQGQLTTWGSVRILPYEITGRAVDLAIPAGAGTEAQMAALQALQQYAATVGVTLNIIPVP